MRGAHLSQEEPLVSLPTGITGNVRVSSSHWSCSMAPTVAQTKPEESPRLKREAAGRGTAPGRVAGLVSSPAELARPLRASPYEGRRAAWPGAVRRENCSVRLGPTGESRAL